MVSNCISQVGLSRGKIDPCGFCCMKVNDSSVLCGRHGKWIHGRCAGLKRLTPKISRNFTCRKCDVIIGEEVEQEEKFCD